MQLTDEHIRAIAKEVIPAWAEWTHSVLAFARAIESAALAAHSAGAQEPVAYTTADRLKRIAERDRCSTVWHASIRDEGDIPLYTQPQPMPQTDAARELLAERERCIKACESVRDRSCAPEHSWAVDDCIAEIERLDRAKGE